MTATKTLSSYTCRRLCARSRVFELQSVGMPHADGFVARRKRRRTVEPLAALTVDGLMMVRLICANAIVCRVHEASSFEPVIYLSRNKCDRE
jgi:hypothetical protein